MYNFIPSTIPNNVFVIGGGGTGSRLIPMLAQFMRSITRGVSPTGWLESPRIWLIDDDVIEAKNILRQNFIDRDVGKHKAVVLADRYSKAYGVEVIPLTMRITSNNTNELYDAVNNYLYIKNNNKNVTFNNIIGNSIVVICVDSVEARRDIFNTFISEVPDSKTFFVDAGNEDSFGQVTFFTPYVLVKRISKQKERDEAELPKLCPVSADIDFIPMDINYYRDLVDTPAQGSCADLNQTLAINAIMATTIMGILQNYFYRKPMSYCGLRISLNGGNSTIYNTYSTFNNMGISSNEHGAYRNKQIFVKEKNGADKYLTFGGNLPIVPASVIRDMLVLKIRTEREEIERLARVALAEAARLEKIATIKIVAERKRLEVQAAVKARLVASKAARDALRENEVKVDNPVSVGDYAIVTAPSDGTTVVPVLVATPRVRAARNMVELTVPESWSGNPSPIIFEESSDEEDGSDNDDNDY